MNAINRSALIVKPAQPFLDWLHQVDLTSARLTLEDLQREPTIYLVPECDSEDQAIESLGESIATSSKNTWTDGTECLQSGQRSAI